jgi:hypothetical protein
MADRTHDALGEPLVDEALYLMQDTRQLVGNCILWWGPNGNGYLCNVDEAGRYTGAEVRRMRRDTDAPWPVEHVLKHTVRHARGDVQAFDRRAPAPAVEFRSLFPASSLTCGCYEHGTCPIHGGPQ